MPTFADILQANPHGWGMGPPATERGYPTTGQFTPSGRPIPDASQMPMFGSAGPAAGLKQILMENGPDAAMLAAGPLTRGAGTALRAFPTLSAALLSGLGLTAVPGEAGDSAGDDMAAQRKLMEQKERLSRQLEDATARQNQNRPSSLKNSTEKTDPNYWNATKEVKTLGDQIGALDKQIEALSPEHAFQRQQNEQQAELDKPFAARHPFASAAMTAGAPMAAMTLAGTGIGKIAGKGKSLMSELLQARQAGDVVAMQEAAAKLGQWNNPLRLYPKQAASILAPATLPMDAQVFGDVVDKYGLPESSKAQQRAAQKLSDPAQYVRNSEQALLMGLTAGTVGAKLGTLGGGAPRGDATAMRKLYGGKDAPTLAKTLAEGTVAGRKLQNRPSSLLEAAPKRPTTGSEPTSRKQTELLPPPPTLAGMLAGPRQTASIPTTPAALHPAQTTTSPASGTAPTKRVVGGSHPDHEWDAKSGRWKDVDGKYLTGKPPKEAE